MFARTYGLALARDAAARCTSDCRPVHSDRELLMATTGPAEYGHD